MIRMLEESLLRSLTTTIWGSVVVSFPRKRESSSWQSHLQLALRCAFIILLNQTTEDSYTASQPGLAPLPGDQSPGSIATLPEGG
jgi:hypothetical protein